MLRYKLRTLLLLLAILPPVLGVGWWKYSAWRAERERHTSRSTVTCEFSLAIHHFVF